MSQTALPSPKLEDFRVLSLTQPWATAMALGIKKWETRSWNTAYRGYLAIHAAKGFPRDAKEFAKKMRAHSDVWKLPAIEKYPLGSIVAVGLITETRRTEDLIHNRASGEFEWGNYAPGRYAFRFELLSIVLPPILATGQLSLWKPSAELLAVLATLVRETKR